MSVSAIVQNASRLLKNFASEYKVVLLGLLVIVLSSGLMFQYCETRRVQDELKLTKAQFEKNKKVLHDGYSQIINEIKRIESDYSSKIEKVKLQLDIDKEELEENIKKDIQDLSKDFVRMSELLKMMGFEEVLK